MNDNAPTGPAWIPSFLATLAETGKVGLSVKAAGVLKNAVYQQRKTNRGFAEAWEALLATKRPARAVNAARPGRTTARNIGWRTVFLESLAETSNVSLSAIRANVPLRTVYRARRGDPAFAARWREALHEGYDNLEMEVLGHLRDPAPERKMDVAAALRLLAAHRETVTRERALREDDDEQEVLDSIDRFIEEMRERRAANAAILNEAEPGDGQRRRFPVARGEARDAGAGGHP